MINYTYIIIRKEEDNMGMIILTALILTELAFMIWNIAEGDLHRKEKAVSAIAI